VGLEPSLAPEFTASYFVGKEEKPSKENQTKTASAVAQLSHNLCSKLSLPFCSSQPALTPLGTTT